MASGNKPVIPAQIGNWTAKEVLGNGTFGMVLSAERRQVNGEKQYAAIKIIRPDNRDKPQLRQMFMHEFEVLKRLETPYIAKVLDSGQDDFNGEVLLWFATELVKGENLAKEIAQEGILDKSQWLELAHDLLAAAAVTHEAGVVHLDIKPANLMRFSRRSILVDFGGASYVAVADPGDEGVYTLGFCAPEQIDNKIDPADYGYEVDIFSIGATLVYAATGLLPWEVLRVGPNGQVLTSQEQVKQAHYKRLTTTQPRLDGMDKDQVALVQQMLATSQAMRPTAVELLNQVKSLLPEGSIRKLEDIRAKPTRSVAPRYKAPAEGKGFKQAAAQAIRDAAQDAGDNISADGLRKASSQALKQAAGQTTAAAIRTARERGWFQKYGTTVLLGLFTAFIGAGFRFNYLEKAKRATPEGLTDRKINAYILTVFTWGFASPFIAFSWWRSSKRAKFVLFLLGQLALIAAIFAGNAFAPAGSRADLDASMLTQTELIGRAVMSLSFLGAFILSLILVGQAPQFETPTEAETLTKPAPAKD
jgi:serine/threonine protein kinase